MLFLSAIIKWVTPKIKPPRNTLTIRYTHGLSFNISRNSVFRITTCAVLSHMKRHMTAHTNDSPSLRTELLNFAQSHGDTGIAKKSMASAQR